MARATVTSCASRPGAPRMRGRTPSCTSASRKACMPDATPSVIVPMTFSTVSSSASSPTPSATRTMTRIGVVWSAIASSAGLRVPPVPATPIASRMLVTRTGVSSGKAASSASAAAPTGAVAVAIKPMMALATGAIARAPVVSSLTVMPWWKGMTGSFCERSGGRYGDAALADGDGQLDAAVGGGQVDALGEKIHDDLAVAIVGRDADVADGDARFPPAQGHGRRGEDQLAGQGIGGLVDQVGQHGAIVAAHHPRAERRAEGVGDRLSEGRVAAERGAGEAVHAVHS